MDGEGTREHTDGETELDAGTLQRRTAKTKMKMKMKKKNKKKNSKTKTETFSSIKAAKAAAIYGEASSRVGLGQKRRTRMFRQRPTSAPYQSDVILRSTPKIQ